MCQNKRHFFNLRFFFENHLPTRHIKSRVIDFVSSNKPLVEHKLPSKNLEIWINF